MGQKIETSDARENAEKKGERPMEASPRDVLVLGAGSPSAMVAQLALGAFEDRIIKTRGHQPEKTTLNAAAAIAKNPFRSMRRN